MTNPTRCSKSLRQRLCEHERLRGTFVKLAGGHSAGMPGAVGLDFVVIDAEHGPCSRAAKQIVKSCRYQGGRQGFSAATRLLAA